MWSVPSRRKLSSQAWMMLRRAPGAYTPALPGPPNFVAMTTSSRRLPRAVPRNSSDLPPPYISAVSKNVMPSSTDCCTTAVESSASMRMPKLLHPSPRAETVSPLRPSCRYSIRSESMTAVSPVSSWDDYPVHQAAEFIRHPQTSDRNFYDRYYFNAFDTAGEWMAV